MEREEEGEEWGSHRSLRLGYVYLQISEDSQAGLEPLTRSISDHARRTIIDSVSPNDKQGTEHDIAPENGSENLNEHSLKTQI